MNYPDTKNAYAAALLANDATKAFRNAASRASRRIAAATTAGELAIAAAQASEHKIGMRGVLDTTARRAAAAHSRARDLALRPISEAVSAARAALAAWETLEVAANAASREARALAD